MRSHKRIPSRVVVGSDLGITCVPLVVAAGNRLELGPAEGHKVGGRKVSEESDGAGTRWLRAGPRIC